MTELQVRFATFVVLAVGAGGITADLVRGFWVDYGWPWARKPGTNGRWRTDALVVVVFGCVCAISVVSVAAIAVGGWPGARLFTTVMLVVLAGASVGTWLSGRVERRIRRDLVNEAAARTERAADRAEAASEDTRRSARKAEVAAEAVIARMAVSNEAARAEAAATEERAEAREERAVALEERALERDLQAVERAASVAEAASEDTRRSAHRTEIAADVVIRRVDGEDGS